MSIICQHLPQFIKLLYGHCGLFTGNDIGNKYDYGVLPSTVKSSNEYADGAGYAVEQSVRVQRHCPSVRDPGARSLFIHQ